MSTGRLIITTPNADVKVINRLLLHIRDWVSSEDPYWDYQHIHFTRRAADVATLGVRDQPDLEVLQASTPPVQPPLPKNEWAGLSIAEVEKIMFPKKDCGLFLLLDDEGIQTQTLIVAERAVDIDFDTDEYTDMPGYSKVRVPWDEVHLMWCNLNIANMGFDDYCAEERLPKENGYWWTYRSMGTVETGEEQKAVEKKRDRVIRELQALGLA